MPRVFAEKGEGDREGRGQHLPVLPHDEIAELIMVSEVGPALIDELILPHDEMAECVSVTEAGLVSMMEGCGCRDCWTLGR